MVTSDRRKNGNLVSMKTKKPGNYILSTVTALLEFLAALLKYFNLFNSAPLTFSKSHILKLMPVIIILVHTNWNSKLYIQASDHQAKDVQCIISIGLCNTDQNIGSIRSV